MVLIGRASSMEIQQKHIPQLRFPEFLNDGEWEVKKLGEVAERITHKVGNANLRPVSISAGIGFVDQKNKFGRDISGNQYSNYIVLKKGEFAYNKGNSIKYPQGCVYKLKEFDVVACPSVFVCFRIIDENVCPDFLSAYFANNYHGIQLQQFITSGVRSNGLLNISAEDFFSIHIPFPPLAEQRRIAACLSALDEMLAATNGKLEQMKAYKKGLMQKLFPAKGKKLPELRFKEFEKDGEWEEKKLGEIITTLSPTKKLQSGKYKAVGSFPIVDQSQNYICGYSDDVEAVVNTTSENLIVFGDHTCTLKFVDFPFIQGADGIKIFKSSKSNEIDERFLYQALLYNPIVSKEYKRHFSELKEQVVCYPKDMNEQRKIASCLSSMDDQINAYLEKVALLEQYKKGLMQQMFPTSK